MNTIGIDETMRRLGIKSKRTLYRMIHEGTIKPLPVPTYFKKRNRLEFTEDEVARVIRESTQAA